MIHPELQAVATTHAQPQFPHLFKACTEAWEGPEWCLGPGFESCHSSMEPYTKCFFPSNSVSALSWVKHSMKEASLSSLRTQSLAQCSLGRFAAAESGPSLLPQCGFRALPRGFWPFPPTAGPGFRSFVPPSPVAQRFSGMSALPPPKGYVCSSRLLGSQSG